MKMSDINPKVTEIKPLSTARKSNSKSVFLAGSIDMDRAEKWQDEFISKLKSSTDKTITVFNPRRDDWDSSWKQTLDDKNFYSQVQWELEHLRKCDIIFLNLTEDSKAPISLLELGLFANSRKIIIVCHDKFYRRGNIEFICNEFDIPLFSTLDKGLKHLIEKL